MGRLRPPKDERTIPSGRGDVTPYRIGPGDMVLEDGATGQRATLTFLVEDVTGAGPRVLIAALRAPAIPRIGDLFEGSDTLLVTRLNVTNIKDCTTKWNVVVSYGWPDAGSGPFETPPSDQTTPVLETDSTVVIKRTNIWLDRVNEVDVKKQIRITGYKGLVYNDAGQPTGFKDKPEPDVGGMVDVPAVVTILRYMRRELPVDSRGRGIARKARDFVGRSNDQILVGDAVRTWLCSRIGASSDDAGLSYNMTYEFMYNVDTWDPTAVYIDPKTGQPGDGVGYELDTFPLVPGDNGVKIFRVTKMANFEDLDLQL